MGIEMTRNWLLTLTARGNGLDEDAVLLERYFYSQDQSAFNDLMHRYARLVWNVSRQMLSDETEAEDAFQATFLALSKSAGRLSESCQLAAWLHRVTFRICLKIRRTSTRRKRLEQSVPRSEVSHPLPDSKWDNMLAAVHEEVARLPELMRIPFVLSFMEGMPNTAAAQRLGWKIGTYSGRLARAKQLILARLDKRGLPLMAVGFAVMAGASAQAVSPYTLKKLTALLSPTAMIPTKLTSLVKGVVPLQSMSYRWLAVAVILLGSVITGSVLLNAAHEPSPVQDKKNAAKTEEANKNEVIMRVKVVGEDKKPVAGASVYANARLPSNVANQTVVTDPEGVATLRFPKSVVNVRMWVSKAGYAGLFRAWEDPKDDAKPMPLPELFQFVIPKGTTISGRIVDEQGNGIPQARLEAKCKDTYKLVLQDDVHFSGTLAYGTDAAITDQQGRWQLSNVPVPAKDIRLRITHLDYISDVHEGELQGIQQVSTEQLRAGSAVIRMARGANLSGKITDTQGNPIDKAVVVFHRAPYGVRPGLQVLSDIEGKYQVPALKPGTYPITVVAQGFMPELREVELKSGSRQEDFKLGPGKTLKVKVVNDQGQPVRAHFSLDSWRGMESLYNANHPDVLPTYIPSNSNTEGLYQWTWAPSDAVRFNVITEGYQRRSVDLQASDQVQTLTLLKNNIVTGKVIDAKTGLPIKQFRMFQVIQFQPDWFAVDRNNENRVTIKQNSTYSTKLDRTDCDYRLLVEAMGYRTALSQPGLIKNGISTCDFALEPAEPIQGRIVDSQGHPVAGAKVGLANTMQQCRYPYDRANFTVETDEKGLFKIPAQAENFVLFVTHDKGTAQLECQRDQAVGDIKLQAWASMEGNVWDQGQPVVGQRMLLNKGRTTLTEPELEISMQVATNQKGAFTFERVPPGFLSLGGGWHPKPGSNTENRTINLKAGEKLQLDLGKEGTTLKGKIVYGEGIPADFDRTNSSYVLMNKRAELKETDPEVLKLTGELSYRQWIDLSNARKLLGHRSFSATPSSDGTFQISGVPAGDYWFKITLYGGSSNGDYVTALATKIVSIHVSPEQAASQQIVLPPINLAAAPILKVGEILPELQLNDANGNLIDLNQKRGQYLLLHAWKSISSTSVKDFARLRKLRDDWSQDQLALIGLNFDGVKERDLRASRKGDLHWPHAQLGGPGMKTAVEKLGFVDLPHYYLINPEGKVAYQGKSLAEVEKLLNNK